ncbi:hypothetical protein M406DRAFT_327931 [Cryphonectria parasitica EP155]|uniref:Uncharacterized protein n=1 Tax=Cryphonectria parasitica (strain ATCC 38755 / EP155) TaxID=660469 RepID=A0A9P4Y525_CRYP1|nr:uncharacterized protein M406DRAFT_327931 [Cryphonectria parasitica EP155]KAF3766816.1 hypothetical protein M406DRAFT_327931 [Cryphonectria parasitica EP155]
MATSLISTSSSSLDSRVRQQVGSAYYVTRKSDDSSASDRVYKSRYTSISVQEDILISKIFWVRNKAQGLFRRISTVTSHSYSFSRPQPRPREYSRGRPRYRDWEY